MAPRSGLIPPTGRIAARSTACRLAESIHTHFGSAFTRETGAGGAISDLAATNHRPLNSVGMATVSTCARCARCI